ncbi:acyltransferase family protein [Helcococcus ovis]|uniref:acyltransferase family protein n=1 Tax=Helcococcus ovis TaxID=72026 RepID=UPI0038B80406
MKRRYISGIDFLKAIAIISVVLYHINSKMFPGGFIGVDLFFVISGYLLANSLVNKNKEKNGVPFFSTIASRVRQLWPGLFIMVFIITILITIFNKPVLNVSHFDPIAGMTFTSNWWLIINKVGYFDNFVANPFKHLWYIGVMFQSFLLILFLFKGFYNFRMTKNINLFIILISVIGVLSYFLQNYLYTFNNMSRVYYGTDTRIYEIIIGVVGYFFYPIEKLNSKNGLNRFGVSNIVSIVSTALYVYLIFNVSEVYPWVYRIGFLIFALNSFVMVISFGSITNIISKIFSYIPPVIGIGKMSYGIYLWHFPIIILTQMHNELGNPNPWFTAFRIIVTLLIAYVINLKIEKPISRYGFINSFEKKGWIMLSKSIVFYVFLGMFVIGVSGVSVPYISTIFIDESKNIKLADEIKMNNNVEKNRTKNKEDNKNKENIDKKENSEIQKNNKNIKINYKIVLVGDSLGVNVGSRISDLYPDSIIDAKISRQLYNSLPVFEQYKKYDSENTALVVMLGTNGFFSESDLDNIVKLYPKSRKVFINVKMPYSWEKQVNETYANYVKKHPDIKLVDWYSVASKNPDYLASDQTHLMYNGVDKMVELIIKELQN